MLGDKIRTHAVNVWMINTGWSGGSYGTGSRVKLSYTRAMITAALEGKFDLLILKQILYLGCGCPLVALVYLQRY